MGLTKSFRVERPVEEDNNPFWDVNQALRATFQDGTVRPLALGEHALRLVETLEATQALIDHPGMPIPAAQVVAKIREEMPLSFFANGIENALISGVFYRQSGQNRVLAVELRDDRLDEEQRKLQDIIDKELGPPGITLSGSVNITVADVVGDYQHVAKTTRDNSRVLRDMPTLRVNLGPGSAITRGRKPKK